MDDWKPTIAEGCDLLSIQLSPDEGHLLVYIDGGTSVASIIHQTGMSSIEVRSTLDHLLGKGVLTPPPIGLGDAALSEYPDGFDEPTTELPLDQLAGAEGAEVDLPELVVDDGGGEDEWEDAETFADGDPDALGITAALAELQVDDGGWDKGGDTNVEADQLSVEQEFEDVATDPGEQGVSASSPPVEEVEEDEEEIVLFSTSTDEAEVDAEVSTAAPPPEPEPAPAPEPAPEPAPPPPPPPPPRPTYAFPSVVDAVAVLPVDALDIYGQLQHKPWEERAELAKQAQDAALQALCLDPDPDVISALFDNPNLDVEMVKLMARAQQSDEALIVLGARSSHVSDREVQAQLLGNPHVPGGLLHMILGKLSLDQLFAASIKQQISAPARELARALMGERFVKATPHVRVQLVLDSAGACLTAMPDFVLDEDTADLLAQQKYTDAALVDILAHIPTTPLRLLQILYRQPVVLQTPALREALMAHPNWPAG